MDDDITIDLSGTDLSDEQRRIFQRRVIGALHAINKKYRRARRAHRLLRYVISALGVISTALGLYATVEPSRVVSKYAGLSVSVVSAAVVSINEIVARANLESKIMLYMKTRTRLSKLIWQFIERSGEHGEAFEGVMKRFESLWSVLNQREVALYQPRTNTLARSLTSELRGIN